MNFVQKAAKSNREGAVLLAKGDWNAAFNFFRGALKILSVGAASLGNAHNTTEEPVTVTNPLRSLSQSSRIQVQPKDAEPYFAYKEAIVFSDCAEVSNSNIALFLAVIEFNMALSFHLHSIQIGKKSPMVTKALDLYDYCLEHVKYAMECDGAVNILVATLTNKAALLAQETSQHKEVKATVDALVDAITYCHHHPGVFTAKEVEEFQLNLLIFRDLKFAAAA